MMKKIISILILCFLVIVIVGCTKKQMATNPGEQVQQAPNSVSSDIPENDVSVGDNPDTGNLSAPDVDTSGLS